MEDHSPGDILHVESEIVEITPSRSKPHQGIVTVRSTMFNQNREAVYLLTAKLLGLRRPKCLKARHSSKSSCRQVCPHSRRLNCYHLCATLAVSRLGRRLVY